MTKSFQFLFDFGGPNSYLAHKMLPDICARTGAEAVYIPISLGGLFKLTNNQAPFMRYAETPAKRNYEMLEFDRFVKAHALPFKMNPRFPINSLQLMRGAVAAQHLGCFCDISRHGRWGAGQRLRSRRGQRRDRYLNMLGARPLLRKFCKSLIHKAIDLRIRLRQF